MNHSLDNYECNDRLPCWAPYPLFSHKRVAQEPKFNLLGSLLARGLSGETHAISDRICGAAQSCFPIIRLQMNLRTMTIYVVGRRFKLSAPLSTILYSCGSLLAMYSIQFSSALLLRLYLIMPGLPTADFWIARRKLWWIWSSFFRWYRSCLRKQD